MSDTKVETPKVMKPFELIIGDANGELQNADVPVRWCITPTLVREMEERGIEDPHVLIVSCSRHQEFQRQLVPVTELMTYVRFTKAGDMRIYAWLLDGKKGKKELHNNYLRKKNGSYKTDIFYYGIAEPYKEIDYSFDFVSYDVSIPEGVFGKEPPAWIKWFANLWHEKRTVDQCHFRRRVTLAFTLKWIPVLAWATVSVTWRLLMATLLVLFGHWTHISDPKYLFKPFDTDFYDAFQGKSMHVDNNPFFLTWNRKLKNKRKLYEHMLFSGIPFIPIFSVAVFTVLYLVTGDLTVASVYTGMGMAGFFGVCVAIDIFSTSLMWFVDTEVFSVAADKVFGPMFKVTGPMWSKVNTRMSKKYGWEKLGAAILVITLAVFGWMLQDVWWVFASLAGMIVLSIGGFWLLDRLMFPEVETDYTEIRELLCPKDELNVVANYDAIPKKQRTIRLWYLDVKNKVCKPMQG